MSSEQRHNVRLVRVVVCDCGWEARDDRPFFGKSIDERVREHQLKGFVSNLHDALVASPKGE